MFFVLVMFAVLVRRCSDSKDRTYYHETKLASLCAFPDLRSGGACVIKARDGIQNGDRPSDFR